MKNFFRTFAAGSLLIATTASAALPPDVMPSAYSDSIESLLLRDIIQGYPDGTFKPKQTLNRAELLALVMRANGIKGKADRRCFADVSLRDWFAEVVCAAKEKGIVSGYRGGFFKPEEPVNFAEALKITLTAFNIPFEESGGAWYEAYVASAHKHGIISRYSYLPWQPVPRERMADFLKQTMDYKEHPAVAQNGARPSDGCAAQAPKIPPSNIEMEGMTREFFLDLPRNYSTETPHRIIFAFHGRTDSAPKFRGYTKVHEADPDAIVVYPEAVANGNGTYSWSRANDTMSTLRDYAYFDAMLHDLSKLYCVDMNQVYIIGYSLGAWFANALACARADVIRGVGTVGGSGVKATCSAPVAAIIFHNPKDTLAPISGDETTRASFLAANACTNAAPKPTEPLEFHCVRYTCSGDPVLWCPHDVDNAWWDGSYYPHVWPRNAAQKMVEFFDGLPR